MTTRRGFLGSLLGLATAPYVSGFAPTAVAPDRYLNVMDFGAVGDGITDDGPALRRALAACHPGGAVVIPVGTYAIGAHTLLGRCRPAMTARGGLNTEVQRRPD